MFGRCTHRSATLFGFAFHFQLHDDAATVSVPELNQASVRTLGVEQVDGPVLAVMSNRRTEAHAGGERHGHMRCLDVIELAEQGRRAGGFVVASIAARFSRRCPRTEELNERPSLAAFRALEKLEAIQVYKKKISCPCGLPLGFGRLDVVHEPLLKTLHAVVCQFVTQIRTGLQKAAVLAPA
jgi:hypothetical protein